VFGGLGIAGIMLFIAYGATDGGGLIGINAVSAIIFVVFVVPCLLWVANGAAKLLPRSPFHHLEVNAMGLVVRTGRKRRVLAWDTVPAFETLAIETKGDNGTRIESTTWSPCSRPLRRRAGRATKPI